MNPLVLSYAPAEEGYPKFIYLFIFVGARGESYPLTLCVAEHFYCETVHRVKRKNEDEIW